MTTKSINRAADKGGDESGDQKAYREPAHGEGDRPAPISRDQRDNQDRCVKDRAPRNYLRDAEHRNSAPGTRNEVTRRDHGVAVWEVAVEGVPYSNDGGCTTSHGSSQLSARGC